MSEAQTRYNEGTREFGGGNGLDADTRRSWTSNTDRNQTHEDSENRSGEKATSIGERITEVTDTIKEAIPNTQTVGDAAVALAEGIKNGGEYLQSHGIEAISKDVTDLVRRHPVPAVWIGMGVGFILGQALVRR